MLIKNDAPRVVVAPIKDRVFLLPGVNSVDDKLGKLIIEHKWFISNPNLSVVSGTEAPAAPKADDDTGSSGGDFTELSKLNVKEAKKVIADISSIEQLEKILDVDDRKGVQEAAEARIDEINAALEAQKDEEGEGE